MPTAVRTSRDILKAAEAEALLIRERAKRQGLEQARREAAELLLEASQIQLKTAERAQTALLDIALDVVGEVLLALPPEATNLGGRIERAILSYCSNTAAQLRIHPLDENCAAQALKKLGAESPEAHNIKIHKTTSVPRSSFELCYQGCVVRASIAAHVSAIRSVLTT